MKHFGIIGYPLHHSFSAQLFQQKFALEHIDAEYSMYPIERIDQFPDLTKRISFSGMNVTMPYKQSVIPYLDALDETAQAVSAVNVIRFAQGRKIGYNTDVIGFMDAIRQHLLPSMFVRLYSVRAERLRRWYMVYPGWVLNLHWSVEIQLKVLHIRR